MTQYVASTLAAPTQYTGWRESGANDVPQIEHAVRIEGGAGVANKHFITPHGVVTEVTDEDAEFLRAHPMFQFHQKGGYVTILERKPEDADAVAADMNGKDPSAPVTESDYQNDPKNKAPTTGIVQKKR